MFTLRPRYRGLLHKPCALPKSVKVREEVVVRRERTQRIETVRDTVRRDEIEVTRSDENLRSGRTRTAIASSRK